MSSDDEIRANLRENISGVVSTLADAESLRDYARQVPFIDVVTEVYCQWFDDFYHPADSLFRSAFSDEQLAALAELNSALTACNELVDGCTLEDVPQASWWTPVQAASQGALRTLS